MKIIVVSDNHGSRDWIDIVRYRHRDADYFIHCGDIELHPSEVFGFICVRGNNDYHDYPNFRILDVGNHSIFITHGHRMMLFKDRSILINKAKDFGCNIACFGHTHVFEYQILNGVHLINPGSLRYNRDYSNPSYAIIEIDNDDIKVRRMEL